MKNNRGFTLIEVVVVIIVLSVMVSLGVSTMGPQIDHYRLNTAAKETISSLRKGSQIAITQNANQTATFINNADPTRDQTNIAGVLRNLPLGITYGVGGVGAPVNGTSDVGGGAIPGDGITFTGNNITFQSNRIPDEAGEIYLTNSRGENLAVSVNLVGRIRCWRWESGGPWVNC